MENTAIFQLEKYIVKQANLNFDNSHGEKIDIDIQTSGVFNKDKKTFFLTLRFDAFSPKNESEKIVYVECIGTFVFEEQRDDIEDYFYANAIAILFPYLRAFVSTLTLQANIPPLILPTFNLSLLGPVLKEKTEIL